VTDLVRVASVGEPKLTRYGAWTYTPTPSAAQRAAKASSWAGSPALGAQPRGLLTNTCSVRAPISWP
jgi:hypothetical protein